MWGSRGRVAERSDTKILMFTDTLPRARLQDPVMVLVKEYLPGSKAVAINELQVRLLWCCC